MSHPCIVGLFRRFSHHPVFSPLVFRILQPLSLLHFRIIRCRICIRPLLYDVYGFYLRSRSWNDHVYHHLLSGKRSHRVCLFTLKSAKTCYPSIQCSGRLYAPPCFHDAPIMSFGLPSSVNTLPSCSDRADALFRLLLHIKQFFQEFCCPLCQFLS